MDLTHKIVRRLLRDDDVSFSRNKNFEAHEDAIVQRARRLYRHLRSIENDLLEARDGEIRLDGIERGDNGVVVRLSYPASGGRRESYVSEPEWNLLIESARVAEILRRLLDEASSETQKRLAGVAL